MSVIKNLMSTTAQPEMVFDPSAEHDACGVGIVANENAQPSRDVVVKGLKGLGCQQHRGGVACDDRTGDGAGIKSQIPQKLFRDEYAAKGGNAPGQDIGVGMFFMPRQNEQARERCRQIVEQVLAEAGFDGVKWRDVPIDTSVLGELAEENRGHIAQIMFPHKEGQSLEEQEKALYVARHQIMRMADDEQLSGIGSESFYIPSLSVSSVIYKGMTLAPQLANFYTDLHDERFESSYIIFHQRFSTNTTPKWQLAHPFHYLAHNGEVNTVSGNRAAMAKHEARLGALLSERDAQYVLPVIIPGRSDSADLSASLGFWKVTTGYSLSTIKTIHVPPAFAGDKDISADEHAMYEYIDAVSEPWDGPSTLIMSDESMVVAGGDRNGLRPIRLMRTSDGLLIVTSEVGSVPYADENLIESGYLAPGEMIALDLKAGKVLRTAELNARAIAELGPELGLLKNIADIKPITSVPPAEPESAAALIAKQALSGYSEEFIDQIIAPQIEGGKEAIGSMGDDTPIAVLSPRYRPFSHYFRQQFAQVTNPPIDSIRENHVMSLVTHLGSFYGEDGKPTGADVIRLESPILSNATFTRVLSRMEGNYVEIDCTFPVHGGAFDRTSGEHEHALRRTIDTIMLQAERAAREGKHIVLSDKETGKERAGVPMVLIASAVHNRLNQEGLRHMSSINVRSAECFDPHYAACLIGCGADTINSYLVEDTIAERFGSDHFDKKVHNYVKSIETGLLKIMGKMGIAPVSSYRGARLFDAIGLSRDLVDEFFPGIKSPISGLSLNQLQQRIEDLHGKVYSKVRMLELPVGDFYSSRAQGGLDDAAETHAITAESNTLLFRALETGNYDDFTTYSSLIAQNAAARPVAVRDLMAIKAPRSTKYTEAERRALIKEVLVEMVSGAMSHGSISKPAHETLAVAMNRLGAKSDSGEGGEDPARYGTEKNSAIKQVATGRFGVTISYLNAAQELEIKVAQGAKPGEGGQLPAEKVKGDIPRLRFVKPGTELVSPPPHHDIYSIEDLAQLIHDLKQANPEARVRVKLVSETGVGTVAAGVAKAGADVIHIAGNVGGTGASPESSIKFAGNSWEIGLAEAQQSLTFNNLRQRVKLVTDGGLRTGRDVVMAALMGAEEFSFGTNALIAEGCVLTRQCHTNKCPVGIATQDPVLMQAFKGTPEAVMRYFEFVATEAADIILKELGKKHLVDVIGRADKLTQTAGLDRGIDLSRVLARPNSKNPIRNGVRIGARYDYFDPENGNVITLEKELLMRHGDEMRANIAAGRTTTLESGVTNQDRTLGALTSSMLVRRFNAVALKEDTVVMKLHGHAGQSLGFAAIEGLTVRVDGAANDYVGKSLSGGKIVVAPKANAPIAQEPNKHIIIGNTCLYGATSGELYAAGRAASRYAIRNSGSMSVVEGVGTNGCNYMTGGEVVVLGPVGRNFGNAMTGGQAFVYDIQGTLDQRVYKDSVVILQPDAAQQAHLKTRIEKHFAETSSAWAAAILRDWDTAVQHMRMVVPKSVAAANQNKPAPAAATPLTTAHG